MSAHDIANAIGLAGETVSRLPRQLQDEHVVRGRGREIGMFGAAALHESAAVAPSRSADQHIAARVIDRPRPRT